MAMAPSSSLRALVAPILPSASSSSYARPVLRVVAAPIEWRGAAALPSDAEWLERLQEKKLLYTHSLSCIEAWLRSIGFTQTREDRVVWVAEMPLWHATSGLQIYACTLTVYDLYAKVGDDMRTHLTVLHGFAHSPATIVRFVDVLAKSRNIELLHSTLLSLPPGLCSLATLRAAIRGLVPAREVGKVSALVTLFLESDRPRTLTFIADVVCSVCKLPDVAEKVIKQAEHRYDVSRTERCCELLVITYCHTGMFSDACVRWNAEEGASDGGKGGCYQAMVSWLCKEGRMWGVYMVFTEMVKRGVEVDGEGLIKIKRAGKATEVFREMIACGCEPNMHTYIMLLQGHLGKRGRRGRDPLVNFESIFVGGLVKAGRTLEATKFVERTMWGRVDVPRFDYNKFLYYFSNEEGVLMFEEVGRRLKDVGHVDLGGHLSDLW
ncbi:hypothetical protein E2562_010785 [Oryza meyeriana var. granulata]|uniref:Pentacotripeptide-repeat region of PRORP domain-containing protein n=1 Tax=Oryza meyeriana var. granulata TaxID=110450 RepID=A0A6G1BJZ4_9ORYZ|nr:hypothetical protein E2562_010785 [Oryza meyeriana var. granulata]